MHCVHVRLRSFPIPRDVNETLKLNALRACEAAAVVSSENGAHANVQVGEEPLLENHDWTYPGMFRPSGSSLRSSLGWHILHCI